MIIYLAGTGPHILALPLAGGTSISTGNVDTTWVTNNILITNTGSLAALVPFTSYTDGWAHFEAYNANAPNSGRPLVVMSNSSGTQKVRILGGSSTLIGQWFDGSAWVTIGSWANGGNARHQYDIYVRATVSGSIEFYVDQVLVASLTGDFSSIGNIGNAAFGNPRAFGSDNCWVSQVLFADASTLFAKVKQSLFTAAGAATDWTGAVSAINEQVPDTSTFINVATANAVATFTAAARALTGYTVKGVIVQYSALKGGAAAPAHIAAVLRIGGTNYVGTSNALAFGTTYYKQTFYQDPSTSADWTSAAAGDAALEVGVKSLA